VVTDARHRVDTLRRCIHALGAQRVLVFMNYQQRLKVRMQVNGLHLDSVHMSAFC
jgi:hypothetical protein